MGTSEVDKGRLEPREQRRSSHGKGRKAISQEDSSLITSARVLARVSALVAGPASGRAVLETICQEAAGLFGTDRASLFVYGGGHDLRYSAGQGLSPSFVKQIEELGRTELVVHYLGDPDLPPVVRDVSSDQVAADASTAAASEGIVSFISASLLRENNLIGFFTLYHDTERQYTAAELDVFRTLANLMAVAVSGAQPIGTSAEKDQAKDHFLSALSHELRTPLTSIMGFTQIIRRRLSHEPDTDQRLLDQLQVLWTQAQRLNRLIDTLVDVSRIESGEFVMNYGKVELVSLLKNSIQQTVAQTSTQHNVVADIPAGPLWVDGDARRLEQVFDHMISNAIRYSPVDEPIKVELKPGHAKSGVTISVTDRGPGIPANRRKELLEKFYPSVAPKTGGLGVGLYISKTVVEAHGGKLTLESHADEGTTVSIVLPV